MLSAYLRVVTFLHHVTLQSKNQYFFDNSASCWLMSLAIGIFLSDVLKMTSPLSLLRCTERDLLR